MGDFVKVLQRHVGFPGPVDPRGGGDFPGSKITFESKKDGPFFFGKRNILSGHHAGRFFGFRSRLETTSTHMADAQGEDAVGGHESVTFGTDDTLKDIGVVGESFALGNLESRPKIVLGAGEIAICRANHDVSGDQVRCVRQ